MPSRPKLSKNPPKCLPNVQDNCEPSTTSAIPKELEQQFELELCWCIQQLQNALKSGKLNNKQVQDNTKALNTLMNNSSSMVKKRQVMRLSFGDYRAKMAAEEKKRSKSTLNVKVKPAIPSKKSVFIKKSSFISSNGNTFMFNFEPPKENDISNTISCIKIENEDCNKASSSKNNVINSNFVSSDNSFRFKFNTDEES